MTLEAADTLGRTLKLELDSGRAQSRREAEEIVRGYVLQVDVGPGLTASRSRQIALLTVVNAARRAFPGGVHVRIADDPTMSIPWAGGRRLADAVAWYGGTLLSELSPQRTTIVLGDARSLDTSGRVLVPTFNGWSGGVVQRRSDRLAEELDFPLAGLLAGALAVSEAFQAQRGDGVAARRDVGFSLWDPRIPWRDAAAVGESWSYLPQRVWLLGLGHLGQAHAWALGALPYANPSDVLVMLQDTDRIVPANADTGLLVPRDFATEMKTRLVGRRLEELGFVTRMSERRFDDQTRRTQDEPGLALSGFDGPQARRALESAGFDKVIDVGLGGGPTHYLDLLLHSFPSGLQAADAFASKHAATDPALADQPAYKEWAAKLAAEGVLTAEEIRCGMLEVAGRTVGAAFVGAVAASLALAEAVRYLGGAPMYEVLSVSLRSPDYIDVAPNTRPGPPTNPGFTRALP
ncbi:MAG TPA: hypothetical protein DCK98_01575 [Chloroflexi bacterium]|jgi:hypothetical protein|nr:hypothetical protein [Chloroflexota bacterium]HAL25841.1 hypothetical protein [Chloroflexota bacterium]